MSVERIKGTITFTCDGSPLAGPCPEYFEADGVAGDFAEAVRQVQGTGWQVANESGRWVHRCKDCRGKVRVNG